MTARARAGSPAVMLVTDRRVSGDRPIAGVATAALEGGASVVQVRERDLGGAALLELANALVAAAKRHPRARVVINDRLDVALAARAHGVHLPAAGLPIAAVRRRVPARFLVGRSVHGVAEAREAVKAGADYLVCGPVFETPGKAAFGAPLGPGTLAKVVEAVRVPVWAIGGIDPDNAGVLRDLPIAGVAVIRAVAAADDPAAAVHRLLVALGGGEATPGAVAADEDAGAAD